MLQTLIFFSFIAFGIYWFLNYSELTEWLRQYLKHQKLEDEPDRPIPQVQRHFLFRLMSCAFCASYHLGYCMYLLYGHGFRSFLLAFAVASLAYFWSLLEKFLLRKIL